MCPTYCFVAGTAVLTATGYTAIEEIRAGDLVWSWDEDTGKTALKEVTQTFVNETDELVHLTISREIIDTTPSHPFYVAQKGWYAAESLRAGDILVTVNGEYVILEQVQHEILEQPVTVYNFEVQDYHTYYVSKRKLLTHNACGDTGTYNELRKQEKGSGHEVHHIIEKRFVKYTREQKAGRMQCVVLTKEQHRIYTNKWRTAIPYGSSYDINKLRATAIDIYRNNPTLLRLALNSLI